jgi:hypothetical protein
MARRGTTCVARALVGAAFSFTLLAGTAGAPTRLAFAQGDAELAAARTLFTDALRDEEAGRLAEALDKFRRVQAVRDTQQVRYRVATCLEKLGRLRDARAAYTSAAAGATREHDSIEIARASREKVDALSKRLSHLVVHLSPRTPSDAVVRVDGAPVPSNELGTSMEVDPGGHEVTATASGATPFRAQLSIPEAGDAAIDVSLTPATVAARPGTPATSSSSASAGASTSTGTERGTDGPAPSNRSLYGVLALAGGGALVATSVVLLIVRQSTVSSIERDCPNNRCPVSRQSDITSERDRAILEGPLGIGLGVVGLAGVGLGAYLLATPAHGSATAFTPWVAPGAGGFTLRRAF